MRVGLTFDDVCLIPQWNNVPSRTEPILSTKLTKNVNMDIPILAANMDTVIGEQMAQVLVGRGSVPIFHRFCNKQMKMDWIKKFPTCLFSCGIGSKEVDQMQYWHDNFGLSGVCIDTAHAHSKMAYDSVVRLRSKVSEDFNIIVGNVCRPRAVHDFKLAGANAVKVGIGPGAACTTRSVTGFGVPQFTAIQDCAEEGKRLGIPVIADGGIRGSRDVVLALAAGASSVMIGKLFALTEESPAEKVGKSKFDPRNDEQWAKYRGQASRDFQEDYFGEVKGEVPEGEAFWGLVTGSAHTLIDELLGGLRHAMTYGSARTIRELQAKAEFMQVTPAYHGEMAVRK